MAGPPDRPPSVDALARSLAPTGLPHPLRVDAPYATSSKADVIRKGVALGVPFESTLSCMKPVGILHCGTCSKCRERHDAFVDANVADPTTYDSVAFTRG